MPTESGGSLKALISPEFQCHSGVAVSARCGEGSGVEYIRVNETVCSGGAATAWAFLSHSFSLIDFFLYPFSVGSD